MKNYNLKIRTMSGKEHKIYHVDGFYVDHKRNKLVIHSYGLITEIKVDDVDIVKPFRSNY